MQVFQRVNLKKQNQSLSNRKLVRKKRENFFLKKKRLKRLASRVLERRASIRSSNLVERHGLNPQDIRYRKGLLFLKFFLNNYFFKGINKKFKFKNRNKFFFFWYLEYFRFFTKIFKFKGFKKVFFRNVLKNQRSKHKYFTYKNKFKNYFLPILGEFFWYQANLLNMNSNFFKKIAFYVLKKKLSFNIFDLKNEIFFELSFKRRNYYITFYNFSTGRTILNISAGCSRVNTFLNRRRFFTFGVFKDCFKKLWRFGWNKRFAEKYIFKSYSFPQSSIKKFRNLKRSKFLFFYKKKLELYLKRRLYKSTRKWLNKLMKQNRYKLCIFFQTKFRLHCNSPFKSKIYYNFIKNYVEKFHHWSRYYFVNDSAYIEFEYLIKYRKLRLKNKRRI